jgi:opacity protein-like surface antigen
VTLRGVTIACLGLGSGPAWAARHEISVHGGLATLDAPATDAAVDRGPSVGWGVRAGPAVLRERRGVGFVVLAGYDRLVRSKRWDGTRQRFAADWDQHRLSALGRVDLDVAGFFFPYAVAGPQIDVVRLDVTPTAAPSDAVRRVGVAAGWQAGAGLEFLVPDERKALPVTVGFTVEVGYHATSAARFGDWGALGTAGGYLQVGTGLRF